MNTEADNTPIMGPAGSLHMTLSDLLSHGHEHLLGSGGQGRLLKTETYQRLQTPVLDNYAYGWVIDSEQGWAKGPLIWHNGSNSMWYALLVILPALNAVAAVTSNDGRTKIAEQAAWEIIKHSVLRIS